MPADTDTLAQQIAQLQTQLAFQEDAIGGLDRALALQQQELLVLRRQIALLHERQRDALSDAHGDAHGDAGTQSLHEKPPHY